MILINIKFKIQKSETFPLKNCLPTKRATYILKCPIPRSKYIIIKSHSRWIDTYIYKH